MFKNKLARKILKKANIEHIADIVVVYRNYSFSYDSIANDLINIYYKKFNSIKKKPLSFFINEKLLLKEIKNKDKFITKDATVRLHISKQLKERFEEIFDNFLIFLIGNNIESLSEYKKYRNQLYNWMEKDRFHRESLYYSILYNISLKLNFDELMKMMTDRIILSIIKHGLNWNGQGMLYEFSRLSHTSPYNDYFWRYYFIKIREELEPKDIDEDEQYINRLIINTLNNRKMEILI